MQEWSAGHAAFWDSACRGRGALRAAILRACRYEEANALGLTCVSIMLHLDKFHDSLDAVQIILRLNAMDFPALVLLMHLQMHWAPSVIVAEGVASKMVMVSRSVLAGSGSSNDVARAYLHQCLAEVHHRLPKVRLGSHVDDVHMQLLGMAEHIVPMAVQAIEVFREGIRGAKLKLNAGKSIVVASTMQVAAAVCRNAAADGFPLKPAISGRDLGVDCSAGSRRAGGHG